MNGVNSAVVLVGAVIFGLAIWAYRMWAKYVERRADTEREMRQKVRDALETAEGQKLPDAVITLRKVGISYYRSGGSEGFIIPSVFWRSNGGPIVATRKAHALISIAKSQLEMREGESAGQYRVCMALKELLRRGLNENAKLTMAIALKLGEKVGNDERFSFLLDFLAY